MCPGKYFGASGCLGDHSLIRKQFARLAVDIKLTALIAMPVWGYISTEASATVKSGMAREKPANLVKNRCMSNGWGGGPLSKLTYLFVSSQPTLMDHWMQ